MNKKKHFKTLILIIALLLCACLIGCGEESKEVMYNVTYLSNGTIYKTALVKENGYAVDEEISDEVHDFLGWYLGENEYDFLKPVNSDLELVAQWTHTVTFKNYDGTVLGTIEASDGEELTAPSRKPSRANDETHYFEFIGWDKPLIGSSADQEIIAKFEQKDIEYTVTYLDGTNEIKKETVKKNALANELTLEKDSDNRYDYTFNCWLDEDGNKYDFATPVTKNIELSASFNRKPNVKSISGMKLSIIGASVSTYYAKGSEMNSYYGGNDEFYYPKYSGSVKTVDKTWWYKVIKDLDLVLGINNSWSGSAVSIDGGTKAGLSYDRINTLGENGTPDIIILYIGINDNVSGIDNKTFDRSYRLMVRRVIEKYPNSYIMIANFPYSNYHLNQPTDHAKYSEETRIAYNEILDKIVEDYQTGFVDMASCQTVDNWSQYLGDNLHPNSVGMIAWANQFEKDIKAYFGLE